MQASPDVGAQTAAPVREGLWLGLALALLACLPVLVATYPQMTDYPAHLARFRVMLDGGADPYLARYYGFDWRWSGNLGADLLVRPLAALVGLEAAGRIIAGLIPVLTGLGLVAVSWVLRRRVGFGTILAFAFIWSPSLLMGFLNFALALALALLAFALWVALEGRSWRWAVFVPVGVVVWLAHVAGWGVLGILVFGYEWHRARSWRAVLAPWPLFLPFAFILAGGGGGIALSWGDEVIKHKLSIWVQAMRDRMVALDALSLLAVLVPLIMLARRRGFDGRLCWAALILAALSIVLPRHLFGGDFADYRLVPVALMVACLAISLPTPRWAIWAAAAFVLVRLVVTTQGWLAESRTTQSLLTGLEKVPQGARVATAVAMRKGAWSLSGLDHVGGYAVVRKSALENSNFALADVHMLSLRAPGYRFDDPSQRVFHAKGEAVDLSAFAPAGASDYLWYVGEAPVAAMPDGARVIHRTAHGFLARLANSPDPR